MADVTFDVKPLLQDNCSGVKSITTTKTLIVPPCYIGNIRKGIVNLLNSEVKHYSADLQGVLIGYENVKLKCQNAEVMTESPYCVVNISADFFVFKPEVGDVLKGVVNKTSLDHIGCIVNGLYNVSLPKSTKRSFREKNHIPLGSEVLFRVIFLDLSSRVVFIRGQLIKILNLKSGADVLMDTDDGYGSELIPSGMSASSTDEPIHVTFKDNASKTSHIRFSESDDSDGEKKGANGPLAAFSDRPQVDEEPSLGFKDLAIEARTDSQTITSGEESVGNEQKPLSKKRKKEESESNHTKKKKKRKLGGESDGTETESKKRKRGIESEEAETKPSKQNEDTELETDANPKKRRKKEVKKVSEGLTEDEKALLKMLKAKEKKFKVTKTKKRRKSAKPKKRKRKNKKKLPKKEKVKNKPSKSKMIKKEIDIKVEL